MFAADTTCVDGAVSCVTFMRLPHATRLGKCRVPIPASFPVAVYPGHLFIENIISQVR